jgi:hypothetical protein
VLFRKEGYGPLVLNASRVKLIRGFQTPLQVTTSCRHDHNSLVPFSSVVVNEGHEQLIPFIGEPHFTGSYFGSGTLVEFGNALHSSYLRRPLYPIEIEAGVGGREVWIGINR